MMVRLGVKHVSEAVPNVSTLDHTRATSVLSLAALAVHASTTPLRFYPQRNHERHLTQLAFGVPATAFSLQPCSLRASPALQYRE